MLLAILAPTLLPACSPPRPARRLLLEDGDAAPPLPLRLPSLGGQQALALALAADELLGAGADAAAAGLLDPSLLPHPRGPLTFATGVSLKMAVSRLQRWAADCGVREERLPPAGRSTEMSDYRLFPCLRATADLLMMPKQAGAGQMGGGGGGARA
jgi:hypothetical protein